MKPTIGRAAEANGSCTKYWARPPMTTRLAAMATLAGYVMRILTPSAGMVCLLRLLYLNIEFRHRRDWTEGRRNADQNHLFLRVAIANSSWCLWQARTEAKFNKAMHVLGN